MLRGDHTPDNRVRKVDNLDTEIDIRRRVDDLLRTGTGRRQERRVTGAAGQAKRSQSDDCEKFRISGHHPFQTVRAFTAPPHHLAKSLIIEHEGLVATYMHRAM